MEHTTGRTELVECGYVNEDSNINRLWVNAPDALYFVDFGSSAVIQEGLEIGDPAYWSAVVEYATEKIDSYRTASSRTEA